MTDTQINFSELAWNRNSFRIERAKAALCIVVDDLSLNGKTLQKTKLIFINPESEWAMLWDDETKEWKEHPDKESPIGNAIIEAFSKPVGRKLKFSFSGKHKLGLSRWGFSAENYQIEK